MNRLQYLVRGTWRFHSRNSRDHSRQLFISSRSSALHQRQDHVEPRQEEPPKPIQQTETANVQVPKTETTVTTGEGKLKMIHRPLVFGGKTYLPIYYFPYVIGLRALARLKLYQTGILTIAAPVCIAAYSTGSIQFQTVATVTFLNMVAFGVLAAMSYYFRRWIGRIYADEDCKEIVISHLTFWGNRRNFVMNVEDVEPIDDLRENTRDVFIKFKRLDDPSDFYFWSLRFGGILDRERFIKIFGVAPDS